MEITQPLCKLNNIVIKYNYILFVALLAYKIEHNNNNTNINNKNNNSNDVNNNKLR